MCGRLRVLCIDSNSGFQHTVHNNVVENFDDGKQQCVGNSHDRYNICICEIRGVTRRALTEMKRCF